MMRIKTVALICVLAALFSTCGCGVRVEEEYPTWEEAADDQSFANLFADKINEYSVYYEFLSENIADFSADVSKGKSLLKNKKYLELRGDLLAWCHGVDTYTLGEGYMIGENVFAYFEEISAVTREYVEGMDKVENINVMVDITNKYVESVAASLKKIGDASDEFVREANK